MSDVERTLFHFTGPIRPGLISPKRAVPKEIPRPDYIGKPGGASPDEERSYNANKMFQWRNKDLECIREIAQISRDVLDIAMAAVRPGMMTDEIDRIVHEVLS